MLAHDKISMELEKFVTIINGEVQKVPETVPGSWTNEDIRNLPLPSLKANYKDRQLFVSFSPIGGDITSFVDLHDGSIFAKIHLATNSNVALRIKNEGLSDKVHKMIGLIREIEIGLPSIDKRYLFETQDEKGGRALCQKIAEYLESLEEFACLRIEKGFIKLSIPIDNIEDLSVNLEQKLIALSHIADIIEKIK